MDKYIEHILESDNPDIYRVTTSGKGPAGKLPVTDQMLRDGPSGDLFGWTQNAGMGWEPDKLGAPEILVLSTLGGMREETGKPIALGYHTGHWEVGLLVKAAADCIRREGGIPFAAFCSDPCDGRTQGTPGMFDSLAYRNDAAIVLRRQIRSLPTRSGVIGVATCDKGLPAMMMALAGANDLPGILIPGGVTLPATGGEDAGMAQSIGARYAHEMLTLEEAAIAGCNVCGSSGGGCQFLGTAATAQVVGEALGLSLPHAALSPSGSIVWRDCADRSARAVLKQIARGDSMSAVLSPAAIENAMVVHAAFGGSTNLLIHLPAIAHAAGLKRPTVADWKRVNNATPRLVSVLPNGPVMHPTVRVFLAGGVPEVMLRLRAAGLLDTSVYTASGLTMDEQLDWWKASDRRRRFKTHLREQDGVSAEEVIFSPDKARSAGLSRTLVFPTGNIAPKGSVVKATAVDPTVLDESGCFESVGHARVFTSEQAAIAAIKSRGKVKVAPGDVLVMAGVGPMGTGMEETYQVTAALKHLPWGKHVAVITDARFSGVSTGVCIGHIGPEGLAGGPIGKLRDGDLIRIFIDPAAGEATIDLVGDTGDERGAAWGSSELQRRSSRSDMSPHRKPPADTQLWALLQATSGGIWGGCVYDLDTIRSALNSTGGEEEAD